MVIFNTNNDYNNILFPRNTVKTSESYTLWLRHTTTNQTYTYEVEDISKNSDFYEFSIDSRMLPANGLYEYNINGVSKGFVRIGLVVNDETSYVKNNINKTYKRNE